MYKKFVRLHVNDGSVVKCECSMVHRIQTLLNIFIIENRHVALVYLGVGCLVLFSLDYKVNDIPIIYKVWRLSNMDSKWLKTSNNIIRKFIDDGIFNVVDEFMLFLNDDEYLKYSSNKGKLYSSEIKEVNELYNFVHAGKYYVADVKNVVC